MARAHRMSIAGGVIVCLLSTQWSAMLFASEATTAATQTQSQPAPLTLNGALLTTNPLAASAIAAGQPLFKPMTPEFAASAGQIYRGRPYRSRRDGSVAALIIGSAAVIAGTAVLVYANRPECSTSQVAGGCGYGTKVIGTSVLAGGAVGLFVGALTW